MAGVCGAHDRAGGSTPSSIAHALTAAAVGAPLAPPTATRRYWLAGMLCAVLPDIDAVGRPFGWGDLAFLGGHRALTHSITFALLLGLTVAAVAFREARWQERRPRIAAYLILATASHGLLDAFAGYGEGVEFLSPFSAARYTAPWRPLLGLNEIAWIWLPALLIIVIAWRLRRPDGSDSAAP